MSAAPITLSPLVLLGGLALFYCLGSIVGFYSGLKERQRRRRRFVR